MRRSTGSAGRKVQVEIAPSLPRVLLSTLTLIVVCAGFVTLFSDMVTVPVESARGWLRNFDEVSGYNSAAGLPDFGRSHVSIGVMLFRTIPLQLEEAKWAVAGSCLIVSVLYILDFSYWRGALGKLLRRVSVLAAGGLVLAASILVLPMYPQYPIAMYIIVVVLTAVLLRTTLFSRASAGAVASTLGQQLMLVATLMCAAWVYWVWTGSLTGALAGEADGADNNFYTAENKARWAMQMDCEGQAATLVGSSAAFSSTPPPPATAKIADGMAVPEVVVTTPICPAAFLLWGSPLVLSSAIFSVGVRWAGIEHRGHRISVSAIPVLLRQAPKPCQAPGTVHSTPPSNLIAGGDALPGQSVIS